MEAVMKVDPAPETAAWNSDSHSPGATGHVHSGRRGFQLMEATSAQHHRYVCRTK